MDLRQTLKLSQQLVMTPQLQQAIKLLQLSRVELIDTINTEMETNPALEVASEQEDEQETAGIKQEKDQSLGDVTEDVSNAAASEKEIDWEQYIESYSANDYATVSYEKEDAPSYDNVIKDKDTLAEHLRWQMRMSKLDEIQRGIADFIIGNIDDDGYLKSSVDEIAEASGSSISETENILEIVQGFDPVGIAARDLKECLLLQAESLGINSGIVVEVIKNHLADIEKRRLSLVCRETGKSMQEVISAVKVISEMEPRPGRPFVDDNTQYITPDLYVYKVGDKYAILMNEDGVPRLRVSNYYRKVMDNGSEKGDAKDYIKDKMRSAVWLIKSIQQRQRTIYKVMESILKFQHDFFDRGVEYLKPLVLKEIADLIGMHESTISRVTNNKYVHTPHGIFELKFFFNSGISRYGAEDIASESVKEKIRQIIAAEDHNKPLSDQSIVELIKKSNINIARRTVTKYREMIGLPSSSKRKKLF